MKNKQNDKKKEVVHHQTEFERQQDAWFDNNCQGDIEDYVEEV